MDSYNDLVKDDDDIVGMITYAFYKKHKKQYFERNISGKKITEVDIKNFQRSITPNLYKSFQLSAVATLKTATDGIINEHQVELLERVLKESTEANKLQKERIEELVKHQEKMLSDFDARTKFALLDHVIQNNGFSWKAFSLGIAGNLIASFLWLLAVVAILSVLDDSKKEEVINTAQKVFLGKEMPDSTKTK